LIGSGDWDLELGIGDYGWILRLRIGIEIGIRIWIGDLNWGLGIAVWGLLIGIVDLGIGIKD